MNNAFASASVRSASAGAAGGAASTVARPAKPTAAPRGPPVQASFVADGGVLVASGFITGEALMGILVAGIIVACSESPGLDAARKTIVTWCETNFASSGPWLGFAALVAVGIYLFQEASKKRAE